MQVAIFEIILESQKWFSDTLYQVQPNMHFGRIKKNISSSTTLSRNRWTNIIPRKFDFHLTSSSSTSALLVNKQKCWNHRKTQKFLLLRVLYIYIFLLRKSWSAQNWETNCSINLEQSSLRCTLLQIYPVIEADIFTRLFVYNISFNRYKLFLLRYTVI